MERLNTELTPKQDFEIGQEINRDLFGERSEEQWHFPTVAEIVNEKDWTKGLITVEDLYTADLQLCSTDDYRYVVSALNDNNIEKPLTSAITWIENWDIVQPSFRNRLNRIDTFRKDLSFLVGSKEETIKKIQTHKDSPLIVIYNPAYTTGHMVDGNKRLIALMKEFNDNPDVFKDMYLPIWIGEISERDRQRYNQITSLVPWYTPGFERVENARLNISMYLEVLKMRKRILNERNSKLEKSSEILSRNQKTV